jgi:hypothetical protein
LKHRIKGNYIYQIADTKNKKRNLLKIYNLHL